MSRRFFDGANIYVGTVLVSWCPDGGNTFALSGVGGFRHLKSMVPSPAQSRADDKVLLLTESRHVSPAVHPRGLFKLPRRLIRWIGPATACGHGIAAGDGPAFVAMAQNDIFTAYLAGNRWPLIIPFFYKTANGGTNWQSVLLITNNQNIYTGWAGYGGDRGWTYGAGALGLAVAPNDSSKVIYTDLGFAHLSTNGGAFWKQVYLNPADQNPTNAPTPPAAPIAVSAWKTPPAG